MKNSFKIMVLAAIPLSLGGCVDVGDLMDQPQSQEKPIYVQNSLSLGGQSQAVSVQRTGGAYPDQVEVCLFNSRGWDKQFSVENYPAKRAAAGSTACTNVNAAAYTFHFQAAGFLGAMEHKGSHVINLTNLEGGKVTVSWGTD